MDDIDPNNGAEDEDEDEQFEQKLYDEIENFEEE